MTPRGHRLLPHTADAGLEALGPDLATTFEEAGYALASLTSDIAPEALLGLGGGGPALPPMVRVRLEARDLPALAFAWLDELVGRVDLDGALAAVEVEAVEPSTSLQALHDRETWRLRALVATLPFDGVHIRRRAEVKAATYHRLTVEPDASGGWRLTAYLDI